MGSSKPKRDLTYMGAAVVLLAVLVAADFAYFSSIETPEPAFTNESDSPARATAQDAMPAGSGECSFDTEKGRIQNYSELVNFFDPTIGEPGASVTVIEYFDPNCPHCATIHPIMMDVARAKLDKALFVFKPFVLWNHSIAQSEALYAAAQEGKFFQMLEHQYAIQQPRTGLGEPQLRAIAQEIGMDPDVLMKRIESGLYRRTLAEQRDKAAEAGVNSTPSVLINGRFVESTSKTAECLKELIDLAAQS